MASVPGRLRVVRGDVLDAASVNAAIRGQDAVLSALGSTARNPAPVLSVGVRHILDAMERHGVRRIVAVSVAGALRESAGFLFGNLSLRIARMWLPGVYREHRAMLEEFQRRYVDWMAGGVVLLTYGPPNGEYRVGGEGILRWGLRFSRAVCAAFVVRALACHP